MPVTCFIPVCPCQYPPVMNWFSQYSICCTVTPLQERAMSQHSGLFVSSHFEFEWNNIINTSSWSPRGLGKYDTQPCNLLISILEMIWTSASWGTTPPPVIVTAPSQALAPDAKVLIESRPIWSLWGASLHMCWPWCSNNRYLPIHSGWHME